MRLIVYLTQRETTAQWGGLLIMVFHSSRATYRKSAYTGTDYLSLKWLLRLKSNKDSWPGGWRKLSIKVEHGTETRGCNADSLLRIPCLDIRCDNFFYVTDQPCGGCSYCIRADGKWRTFTRKVEDAVPLIRLDLLPVLGRGAHAMEEGNIHGRE